MWLLCPSAGFGKLQEEFPLTVCAEDAPDQSSVIEKAAGRALGLIICSKTQLMSGRSDQLVVLCVWSEEEVQSRPESSSSRTDCLICSLVIVCSVKALFRLIFRLESGQREGVFHDSNSMQLFSQGRP